jgi:DNA-binding NtrC family response regulator
MGKILLIGRAGDPTRAVRDHLLARGYETQQVEAPAEGARQLRLHGADLVLITTPLPARGDTLSALRRVREADVEIPVVVAGSGEDVRPEELMHAGAFECVVDPLTHPHRLLSAVGYALGAREEDRELRYLRDRQASGVRLEDLVGESEAMAKVFAYVRRICARTARGFAPAILITGETGTGKGALARAIHEHGVRRNRPFVQINCAAMPQNLVESELFGHERGAFTGASRTHRGLFETAHGGTLFLDELPSLPLDLQAKLLTAIEDRQVRRVGGNERIPVEVQLIAASQPVLSTLVRSGRMREDLYHRLNVLVVRLPPLRDRGADRLQLAKRFVDELCRKYGMPPLTISEGARRFIERYHWPGNVRELRNQIERIVLLSETDQIEEWQFERASGEILRLEPDDGRLGVRVSLPPSGIVLDELEREVIRKALEKNDGNVSRTARYLSISRSTLIYRMKKHDLTAR